MAKNSAKSGSQSQSDGNWPIILWFREDLRLQDNPALCNAIETRKPLIALYIFDAVSEGVRELGSAQKWWLHNALHALAGDLRKIGLKLLIRSGPAAETLAQIAEEIGAGAVFWNRRYSGAAEIELDRSIKINLKSSGIDTQSFRASLLHEPQALLTSSGTPFKVFSPFWRAFAQLGDPRDPMAKPERPIAQDNAPDGLELNDLGLLPKKPDWAGGLRQSWEASEAGAHAKLAQFLKNGLTGYAEGRDIPAQHHISRLSPYLRFGQISPFQLWKSVSESNAPKADIEKFLKELVWREFSYHLLFHYPQIGWKNFNKKFDDFPWHEKNGNLEKWKRGQTGYPIVDAGMRELWNTGYMHNRVRMVAASFLVKHLLIHWRRGEEWFWDTLVDGDPASNSASWQWVAGSGADAAPYFRVFNPIIQGKKFDAHGDYVRKWVPEIAALPNQYIHAPWGAPELVAREAGVKLGENYPFPIVDHGQARERALEAFKATKKEEEDA